MNKDFLALLIVMAGTFCLIAVLYFTSFERHHTHDRPSNQVQAEEITNYQDNVPNSPLVTNANRKNLLSTRKSRQSTGVYYSDSRLQHYDHKSQIIMAGAAVVGLLVALTGLYLIWKTLRATRKGTDAMREALEEAKRATEAAWQAVKVSETTAINQLRAYVGPVDFEIMFTESNEILVAFKIKNTGQTPAINVQLAYCITFLELPIDDSDVDIDAQILDEEQASAFLPKDVTFSAKTDVLNDYDTTKKILCLQGTHAVFVYGKVAYKDIYGQPRTTKFRVAWGKSFRNTQLKNMALCDDGNEMT